MGQISVPKDEGTKPRKEKSQKQTQKEQKMNWTENSKSVINHGSINHHKKQAEKKFLKELKKPERVKLENEYKELHENDTVLCL